MQVEAKCKDTDGNIRNDIGFVDVEFSTQPTEATKRSDLDQLHSGTTYYWGSGATTFTVTAYVLAKGDGNWQFDHWELEDGTTLPNSNQEKGTASHTYNSTNRCPGNSSSGTHEHAAYYTEHTYYAVFRKVVTQVVFAEASPAELGGVKYLKENAIGEEISLRTYTLDYHNKFLGWVKQGAEQDIISRDRVLTFTIDENTKGTYIALYDDGYDFVRFKNFETGRYLDFTSDEGNLQNLKAIELKNSLNDVISEAGSVIEIVEGIVKGSSGARQQYFDYYMQNAKASKFYDFDPTDPNAVTGGVYLRMPHDVDTNVDTWALSTDDNVQSGYRIGDENGSPKVYLGKRNEADWYIEPMDKDLETKENYFSLDPEKLVEVDGSYYTTLRTSWNILFNPEHMTPYVVTSVDETEGTFEMAPITGNIIPAGTPVIIETKGDDIEENRMVPTKTAAANGAVPAGNLLKYSEKYFPNQPAPVSNCKQLMVKDGLLTFGGNALSSVNGNEAYLSVSNDVSRIQKVALAELVADGVPGRNYAITDLIGIAEVSDKANHDHMIICKDSIGYAAKDVKADGWIDYIHEVSELNVPETYDQSNWIALHLPTGAPISSDILNGAPLKGVKGRLISEENPEFMLDAVPTCDGDKVAFTANTYIAASFYGDNHQPGYGGKKQFFFVQPKPMEYATVTWSQWDGGKFVVPSSDDHPEWNQAGLKGQFDYKGDYLEQDSVKLQSGHTYEMKAAVIKYKTATGGTQARAPRHAEGASKQYVVYPLTITRITDEQNGVITGVQQLSGDRQVMRIDYYNVSGMRSERPWQGVNIVVTRYSDGTTSAVKMLR